MRILFIHQNLPGQFQHLIQHCYQQKGWEARGIGERRWVTGNLAKMPAGFPIHIYDVLDPPPSHPYLVQTSQAITRGLAVVPILKRLRTQGWLPDIIYAHPGWGEALYLREVFPDARILHYCEYYYRPYGQDIGFDPEYPSSEDALLELHTRNTHHLLSLESMDLGISPTRWQKQCFPNAYQNKIQVIHDGIDTQRVSPDATATLTLNNGQLLSKNDEIISFVNRNLEPYRGFHVFMRSLPDVLTHRPKAQVLIAGGDSVSYGKPPSQGSYRQQMLLELHDQLHPHMDRIHFLGKIPYTKYLQLLRISSAHVYFTYPFVLSWSLLEAMACGAPVLASRTAPVEEVIHNELNGYLIDFFSIQELSRKLIDVLDQAKSPVIQALRMNARQTVVDRYDLQRFCLPQQMQRIMTS